MSRTPFSKLISAHFRNGARPEGLPGVLGTPWTPVTFAEAVGASSDDIVRRWLSGARRPKNTINIERAFFGDNAAHAAGSSERRTMQAAVKNPGPTTRWSSLRKWQHQLAARAARSSKGHSRQATVRDPGPATR
jgi:hypothetical protein